MVSITLSHRNSSKLIKLATKYPDLINITVNKDGSVFGHVPVDWIKIRPKQSRNISEEQRAAASVRLKEARSRKKSN